MGRTVAINQDKLKMLKEIVVDNHNIISHKNVYVNEASPEASEFELCIEDGDQPLGGGYVHVKEGLQKLRPNVNETTFETWFGNSVLKDENGMPLKMYHGTGEDFNAFDKKTIGRSGAYEGYGFNFTPFKSRAMGYNSKNVIEAYLKVENPMTSKTHKITLRQLMSIISELDKGKPFTDTIVAAYEPARYNENWDAAYYRRALPTAARAIYDYNKECGYGDAGLYAELCINGQADKLETISAFEKMGYDGAIFYDNDDRINTVVVFEPNQIKRTTNKTFNPNSDIMDEDNAINEGYCGSKLKYIDLSDVGLVKYEWYFDEDEYNEWLADNELTDSEETRHEYYVNEVTYEVEYCDNYSQHTMDVDQNVSYSDLEELFGENMAEKILSNCIKYGEGKFETFEMYEDSDYDVNNPQELNDIAVKLFSHGEYYKDCRGFILTNGVVIYTPSEHNEITILNNVNDKFDFVRMGNIRVLPNSINIYTEPTYEQELVLRDVIDSYSDDELFLDICNKDDCCGVRYDHPNWRYVLGEIERYYSEGIRPQGNQYFESKNNHKETLNESQESKSISAAKSLVMQRLGYNEQQADEFVRIKLRNDLPILRSPQGSKFILGVTRMFCDGEIRTANEISNLNSTLKLVSSDAHINEYDRNLNGLSCQDLIQRFAKAMSNNLETEKSEIERMVFDTPSNYEIVRIDTFKDATRYGRYTSWCVIHDKGMFDSYTSDGTNQFYFCLRHGFENVKKQPSEGCPLDEYGLSMIAVSVNENGMLNTCTCRWNHDNGANDSVMTAKELSQLIGMNFFEVFKPNGKWQELLNDAMQRLANGEQPQDVFDWCGDFNEGFAAVELNDKCNFIDKNGNYLSKWWFDNCGDFHEGFARVRLNDNWNYVNKSGNYLSEQWLDWCDDFNEGFGKVCLNGKYNYIDKSGNYLSKRWFDDCGDFYVGFAIVVLNGEYYRIDKNGNLLMDESKNNKKVLVSEEQLMKLNESQESKSISAAKRLVMQRLGYDEQQADEFVRVKLRNDIPALSEPKPSKFILGAARMYCDGQLTNSRTINDLNSTLELVSSDTHINEYDRNLNGLSAQQLIDRFAKVMNNNLEAEKGEVEKMTFNNTSDYQIVRIDSFKEAKRYGKYTSWCVTHNKRMFDSYTCDGINQFYFCLKPNFETIKRIKGETYPSDEYGLSMIAVSVDDNGWLHTCTCRWNHGDNNDGACNDKFIKNMKGLAQFFGFNPFEVFKPNGKWQELLNTVTQRIANGERPQDVFDECLGFCEGFSRVVLNDRYNYIDKSGTIISKQWFDWCSDFHEGFAKVKLNNKYNYVDENGNILSKQWFEFCADFKEGFGVVGLNDRFNHIDKSGNIISKQWFDWCYSFDNGFAIVLLNKKYNHIGKSGSILSKQWFNGCDNFNEGFATVILNGKYNFIDKNGNYLSDQWFDWCGDFHEGFAKVLLNSKFNFIDKSGNYLSKQWFDGCRDFKEGFAAVELDGKEYKIDKNGNLSLLESKNNKKILVSEGQLVRLKENSEFEVDSSEIDLSSFKKKHELVPNIWKPNGKLNSRVRLKLLDIADDFWHFVNLTWVKPKSIILTGSICNFNWSQYSDIDLHLIVDFNEIDEKTEFVKNYLDSKKNEWNNEHDNLNIMGFNVELYVQDIDEESELSSVYDLETDEWIKEPNPEDIHPIGLNKFNIKKKSAEIMTIIDDMYDSLSSTDDLHKIEQISDDADYLWSKIKNMRKQSLEQDGEMGSGNIVYKYMRRKGYLDKLWDLRTICYDKVNSIDEGVQAKLHSLCENESIKRYLTSLKANIINEEWVGDGNASHNPYKKHWDAERKALKDFVSNYGQLMQSKENGKLYKCYYDATLSQLIGFNYCICVQWDSVEMKPKSTLYIRACDKFTSNIKQVQFDTRGKDNTYGTQDDLRVN